MAVVVNWQGGGVGNECVCVCGGGGGGVFGKTENGGFWWILIDYFCNFIDTDYKMTI